MSRGEPVAADRFAPCYEALGPEAGNAGRIARLAWDSDIFGFGVADYQPPTARFDAAQIAEELALWQEKNSVQLVSCRVDPSKASLADGLSRAGFRFVELQLRATLPRVRDISLREPRLTVRFPTPDDRQRLIDIAGTTFQFGRYHADPRFPRSLADLRYRVWIQGALSEQSENTRMFVIGPVGHPVGFLHVAVTPPVADLRLAGVDPSESGVAGPELFLGALRQLAADGIERVTARLSAANTSAINLYASMSFRFHEPEFVFHRGEPRAALDRKDPA